MGKFNLDREFNFKGMPRRGDALAADQMDGSSDTTAVADDANAIVTSKAVKKASQAKVPMMNIRFTPENYAYMRREAAMRGVSVIAFTNWIIDQYRSDPSHVHDNPLYQQQENW